MKHQTKDNVNSGRVVVHVNQPLIMLNTITGECFPTLIIKHPVLGLRCAHEVEGFGRCVDANVRNGGECLDSDGAKVWIEYTPDSFHILGEHCSNDDAISAVYETTGDASVCAQLTDMRKNYYAS
jgi:hypothetical protein